MPLLEPRSRLFLRFGRLFFNFLYNILVWQTISWYGRLFLSFRRQFSFKLLQDSSLLSGFMILSMYDRTPTCFESLDSYGRCVVPEPLPHLPELDVGKLPHELEAGLLNLPLFLGVLGQVGRGRLLNLEI